MGEGETRPRELEFPNSEFLTPGIREELREEAYLAKLIVAQDLKNNPDLDNAENLDALKQKNQKMRRIIEEEKIEYQKIADQKMAEEIAKDVKAAGTNNTFAPFWDK